MTTELLDDARDGVAAFYPPTIDPPYEPLPIYRNFLQFLDNPLASLPGRCFEEPFTVARMAGIKVAWVTGPDLVEQILVRDADAFEKSKVEKRVFGRTVRDSVLSAEGDHWRWQRRTLAPPFRLGDILAYVPTMAEVAEGATRQWTEGGRRDIGQEMIRVTFDVIAHTMLDGDAADEAEFMIRETEAFLRGVPWDIAWELFSLPRWLPHPQSFRMARSAKRLRQCVRDIITRRKATGPSAAGDLLDRLMAASHPDTGATFDDEQLVDNLLALLEAGHDTTARTLAFTLYLLSNAPDWQERVRREVLAVAGQEPLTGDDVKDLVVTRQVIEESLRLYPAAPVLARRATRAVSIAGEMFGPNDQIIVPVYAIHRHRGLWRDPDRFDPDRFAPVRREAMQRTQFMPFGAGPRICLGMSFAMVEATVLLASFVRAARFDWPGGDGPQPISRVTLRPKGGLSLIVTPT